MADYSCDIPSTDPSKKLAIGEIQIENGEICMGVAIKRTNDFGCSLFLKEDSVDVLQEAIARFKQLTRK